MIEDMTLLDKLLLILAIFGGLDFVFRVFQFLARITPFFQEFKTKTWNKLADTIKLNALKKRAISSGIENTLNQVVFELKDELPEGWINRATIQWVWKTVPADLKDRELILRLRPQDDQDLNYLNAIYYFYSSSIFPKTQKIIPANIKKAASLYLSKRTIEKKQPYLFSNFERHFLNMVEEKELLVAGYYSDYNRIDNYGFFNSAFAREVDTLAQSLRMSPERENMEKEISNILNHLLKFEKLNKLAMQEEDWYKTLSATSYGFILVAHPDKKIIEGVSPYLKRAKQKIRLGIKRLYVIGCNSDHVFFNEVLASLTEIKEYRLAETFKLYKDYRGNLNGIGALFVIDTVREALLKNIQDDFEEEIINKEDREVPLILKTDSDVILNQEDLTMLITSIVKQNANADGWYFLGQVGHKLKENYPLFNTYHYGCSSLRQLIGKLQSFEIKEEGDGSAKSVFIRMKNASGLTPPSSATISSQNLIKNKEELKRYLTKIIPQFIDGTGWAFLAKIGTKIKQDYPSFDTKEFGSSNLRRLFEDLKIFDIKIAKRGVFNLVYVKAKEKHASINGYQEEMSNKVALPTYEELTIILTEIISKKCEVKEWAYLASVGGEVKRRYSDFDPHLYNSPTLRHLLESTNKFEIKEEGDRPKIVLFVKIRK